MRDINDYAEKYVTEEPFEPTIVEIRKRMVIEQCEKYKHDNILEIGCGMRPFFMDYPDFTHMVIAEPGDLFVKNARKMAEQQDKDIRMVPGFLEENIEKIKALNIRFDFIILSSVLHELDKPQEMLASVRELCSEETVFHINVPNANSLHRLIAVEAGLINDIHEKSLQMEKMQRRRTYDMNSFREEVHNAGFEVIDSGSYFVKPFTHKQMQRCMDEGIIDERVLTGLEKAVKYMPDLGAGIYVNVKKKV